MLNKVPTTNNSKLLIYESEPDTKKRLESFLGEKLQKASNFQSFLIGIDHNLQSIHLRIIIKILRKIKILIGREFHGGFFSGFQKKDLPFSLVGLRLSGIYQHRDYYKSEKQFILDLIIKELFKVNKSDINILNQTTMHLRRGDYVQKGKGWPLTKKYYLDSLKLIDPKRTYPVLIISDDPFATDSFTFYLKEKGYTVLNLPYDKDYDNLEEKVDYLREYRGWYSMQISNSIRDFKTITQSKNIVMANSSFSWWAATLGDYIYNDDSRKVVYPDGWILGLPDILHENKWLRMSR